MHLPQQPELEEELGRPREKEMFYKTTKLKGINLYGRESLLQPKKRLGGESTKVPRHRRTATDSKAEILARFAERRTPMNEEGKCGFERRRNSVEKVQIIEALENPDDLDDCKSDIVASKTKMDQLTEKVDRQMLQAERLVAKVTQDGIDIDELDLNAAQSSESGGVESQASPTTHAVGEEDERATDITVGEVLRDIAVLITAEYNLFAWPLDMLPRDIKKGTKLAITIRRNTGAEMLRRSAVCALQSGIRQSLSNG